MRRFVDEAADVADLDAEALSDGVDVGEVGGVTGFVQGLAPGVSVVVVHPPAKRVRAPKCDIRSREDSCSSP